MKLGVVPGKDMTVEAALAKLSFVMGKEALTRADRKMVSFTLRFEACYLKTKERVLTIMPE